MLFCFVLQFPHKAKTGLSLCPSPPFFFLYSQIFLLLFWQSFKRKKKKEREPKYFRPFLGGEWVDVPGREKNKKTTD